MDMRQVNTSNIKTLTLFFIFLVSLFFKPKESYADIDRSCFKNWCSACFVDDSGLGVTECYLENSQQLLKSIKNEELNVSVYFNLNIYHGLQGMFLVEIKKDGIPYGSKTKIYLDGVVSNYSAIIPLETGENIVRIAKSFKDSRELKICLNINSEEDCIIYSLEGFKEASHYWLKLVGKYLTN